LPAADRRRSMSGITCRSLRTGHGFVINRTSYRLV
jgi:hypothetical protein